MNIRTQNDAYPSRYSLTPEEAGAILSLARRKGYLTSVDVRSLKRQFKCSAKPIQMIAENHSIPIREVVQTYPDTRGHRHDTKKQSQPTPPTPTPTPTPAPTFDIDKVMDRLERKEADLNAAKVSLDTEIQLARKERDEARKQLADVSDLRKKTSEERKESYDLRQKNQKLVSANKELRRRLDPNSPEWIGELETFHQPNLVSRIKELEEENVKLSGRLAAFESADAKNMNLYFARNLPIDQLEPLLVAIFFEIERRKRGGRIYVGV